MPAQIMCEDCDLAASSAASPSLLLLLPVLLSVVWILFQLFYAPWLLALLITRLANLWLRDSGIYIGMKLTPTIIIWTQVSG